MMALRIEGNWGGRKRAIIAEQRGPATREVRVLVMNAEQADPYHEPDKVLGAVALGADAAEALGQALLIAARAARKEV